MIPRQTKGINDRLCCNKFTGIDYTVQSKPYNDLNKQRKYPYDYELEQKYREFQSNPSKLYKDDEIENALNSLEKMNQIQTLDHGEITAQTNMQQGGAGGRHHGRRRTIDNRMKSRELGRGGGLSGSVSVDDLDRPRINGKIGGGGEGLLQKAPTRNSTDTTPMVKSRKSRKDRKPEISEDTTDDEGADPAPQLYSDKDSDSIKDLSFTLPKPLNLKQQKVTLQNRRHIKILITWFVSIFLKSVWIFFKKHKKAILSGFL